jgi:PKD repeat protein
VFTNTSTISAGTLTHQWSFGDGATASTINATHTYLTAGTYTVKLVTTSNNGCRDSIIRSVTVNPNPIASFNINNTTQCLTGNSFVFTNTSTISAGTLTHQWSFGDGATATTTNATHTYLTAGTYTVKLVTTSNNGCRDSIIRSVVVNPLPLGILNTPVQNHICDGTPTTLTASGAFSYQWYLNGFIIAGATSSTYDATVAGSYTVEFISDQGCRRMSGTTIVLTLIKKPDASFTNSTYCTNVPVSFTNTSIVSGSGQVSYQWMFGDGGSSTSTNPTHTYALPANYMALLTVTPRLCPQLNDTAMKLIRVEAPVAGIAYTPINTVVNVPITLSARNIGVSYLWSPSTGLNNPGSRTPILLPTRQQLYLVRITNNAGCTTIDSQLVRIFEKSNIYVPDAFTPDGKYIDKAYTKNTDGCKYCPFKDNRELCDKKNI